MGRSRIRLFNSPFIQRGHGIGDIFGEFFRSVTPYLFSGLKTAGKEAAKFLGREALRTGGKIVSEIADNPQARYQDIISKNVQDTFQNLSSRMMGRGRKRKRRRSRISRYSKRSKSHYFTCAKTKPKQKTKNQKSVILKAKRRHTAAIRRDIFSLSELVTNQPWPRYHPIWVASSIFSLLT